MCSLFTFCVGHNTDRKSQVDWLSKRAALHFVIILLTKLTINKTEKAELCICRVAPKNSSTCTSTTDRHTAILYLLCYFHVPPNASIKHFSVFHSAAMCSASFRGLYFLQFAVVRYLVLWPLSVCRSRVRPLFQQNGDEFRKHEFVCAHCDRAILNNNTNNEAKRFNIEIAHVSTESRFEDEKQQISCFHSASCFS